MKNKLKKIMALVTVGAVTSCGNPDIKKEGETKSFIKLENAGWLIGRWENKSPEGFAAEIWTKQNDSTYSGKSYFVAGNDTLSSESISLEQHDDELLYIPTVKDQNSGQPVKFALTLSTDKQLIFENPEHDFPQKISYILINNDSLLAEISGTVEGKHNSQKFPMKKVK